MIALTNNIFRGSKKRGLVTVLVTVILICCFFSFTCLADDAAIVYDVSVTPVNEQGECTLTITPRGEMWKKGISATLRNIYFTLPEGCEIDTSNYIPNTTDSYYLSSNQTANVSIYEDYCYISGVQYEEYENGVSVTLKSAKEGTEIKQYTTSSGYSARFRYKNESDKWVNINDVTVNGFPLKISGSNQGGESTYSLSISNTAGSSATVTGTVTDGTATLNVTSEKACVVAYTTDDGATYIPVSAVQADSGYNFVVPDYSENMKFVVAVKGDANGDGAVTNGDVTRLKAIQNGKYQADVIAGLAADVNGDNSLTNSDATRLKAVLNGKASIAW